jgi:hypothetical protein
VPAVLLGDVGHLADGRLPHNEGSNDAQAIAPGRMTPEGAGVATAGEPWSGSHGPRGRSP